MLNASQCGIFTKITSRQARIADVSPRLIVPKVTSIAVDESRESIWNSWRGRPRWELRS